jgi:hypothetical protein
MFSKFLVSNAIVYLFTSMQVCCHRLWIHVQMHMRQLATVTDIVSDSDTGYVIHHHRRAGFTPGRA